jgi:hypothetical protein
MPQARPQEGFYFPGGKIQNYRAASFGNTSVLGLVSRKKYMLLPLGPCDALNFKHLTYIKQAEKGDTSGNYSYFCVTMFEILFSVTKMVKMRERGPLGHILNSVGQLLKIKPTRCTNFSNLFLE